MLGVSIEQVHWKQ